MTFKPIPTDFDGYHFRSRKEARFATMFKALKLEYRYEEQGFDMDGDRYLPDFFLPRLGLWVEVKGTYPNTDEFTKATKLAQNDRVHPVVLTWENFDYESALDNVFFGYDEDGVFHSQQGWRWLQEPERGWLAARHARFEFGENGDGGHSASGEQP